MRHFFSCGTAPFLTSHPQNLSTISRETYDHFLFEEIHKHDLCRCFAELRELAHHIYALLERAPKTAFWIVLNDEDLNAPEKTFTIGEFYADLEKFHSDKDTFRVYIKAYFFRDEWDRCIPGWELMDNAFTGEEQYEICGPEDLTVAEFEKEWPHMLANLCRDAILSNRPLGIDAETTRQYGFTRQDIALLQEPVARFNRLIIDQLRAQYDRLAAIDCLHRTKR